MSDTEITLLTLAVMGLLSLASYMAYKLGYMSGHSDCFIEELEKRGVMVEKAMEKEDLRLEILAEVKKLLPKPKK